MTCRPAATCGSNTVSEEIVNGAKYPWPPLADGAKLDGEKKPRPASKKAPRRDNVAR